MKMKKSLVLLVFACLLLLAGCSKQEHKSVPASERQAAQTETSGEQAAPTPKPTPKPTPTPEPTPAGIVLPPLPDVDIRSWEFLYAGPHCGVKNWAPKLRNFEGQYLDERCTDAALEFLDAARAQGFEVYVASSYFPYEYRLNVFENAMFKYGKFDDEYKHFLPGSAYEAAKHVFAFGCSDHSTGLAFDITDESQYWAEGNYNDLHDETVANTPVCKWMNAHCADYGFIVRYPEDKAEVYGMSCYPGHYRYVGKEAARYIMDNDLCLEEFLALYGWTVNGVNYVNTYIVSEQ